MSASYHQKKDLCANQLAGFKVNVTLLHACFRCLQFLQCLYNRCFVKEMSMFIPCFLFRRDCISPHPQPPWRSAVSPSWHISCRWHALTVCLTSTSPSFCQARCQMTGQRSHPVVQKQSDSSFSWILSLCLQLAMQSRCYNVQMLHRSQRFQGW